MSGNRHLPWQFGHLPPAFDGPAGAGETGETRLAMLKAKYTAQYGDSVEYPFTPSDVVGNNLIKWQGDETDVLPWRVYLGPWQPKPSLAPNDFPAATTSYAIPTPWVQSQPGIFDSMGISNGNVQIFGRLYFGSGGQRHVAYVDWPRRGALVQVSASYVQLDAVANATSLAPANINATQLPILQATLGPEPGGGDSAAPATFTYPISSSASALHTFQVPPFARTFTVLLDRTTPLATTILVVCRQDPGGLVTASWTWDETTAPLGGPVEVQLPIPSTTGVVEVSNVDTTEFQVGALFHLDL